MVTDLLRRRLVALRRPARRSPRHDLWVAGVVAAVVATTGTYYLYCWVSSGPGCLVFATGVLGVLTLAFRPTIRWAVRTNRARGTFVACALVFAGTVAMLVNEVWFAGP
ncbi:MAG TPA: hypothetical protein VGD67_20850 [Pseudonocardiaceae bacterium]